MPGAHLFELFTLLIVYNNIAVNTIVTYVIAKMYPLICDQFSV